MAYLLGKHPPVVDSRTLRFGDYLTSALAPPPASINYGDKVTTWPMYYNDQYGDCTCAAAGHMIQNWTANAATEVTPPPTSILSFYEHFVGTPPPADAGCDMLSVLKYWRSAGTGQAQGEGVRQPPLDRSDRGTECRVPPGKHLHRRGPAEFRCRKETC